MRKNPVPLAWAYLSRVAEPPCAELAALVHRVGPVEAADRVRRGLVDEDVVRRTEARREIDRVAADLELLVARGGEGGPGNEDARAPQRLCRTAILDAIGAGDHRVGVFLGFPPAQEHRAGEGLRASLGRLQVPAGGRKKRLGVGAVGEDLEPALDPPGIGDAPDFDGVRGEIRGLDLREKALDRFGSAAKSFADRDIPRG